MLQTINHALEEALDDSLNARGRSAAHVAAGLALCVGAVLASAVIAYREGPSEQNPKERARLTSLEKPDFAPDKKTFAAVMPPLFLLLTVSGVRIWNAPPSLERTRALSVWGGLQGLHALSMLLGVKQQSAQLVTSIATLLGGLAYARDAKKVDPPSAAIIAPYVSWMAFVNVLTEELWRRNKDKAWVH